MLVVKTTPTAPMQRVPTVGRKAILQRIVRTKENAPASKNGRSLRKRRGRGKENAAVAEAVEVAVAVVEAM